MKPKILEINNVFQARKELARIDVHPTGIDIMSLKAVYRIVEFELVDPKTANIVKQEMLSRGGDCAVSASVGMFKAKKTPMILMGNLAQYARLIRKLRKQTWGECQEIGVSLQELLFKDFGSESAQIY